MANFNRTWLRRQLLLGKVKKTWNWPKFNSSYSTWLIIHKGRGLIQIPDRVFSWIIAYIWFYSYLSITFLYLDLVTFSSENCFDTALIVAKAKSLLKLDLRFFEYIPLNKKATFCTFYWKITANDYLLWFLKYS